MYRRGPLLLLIGFLLVSVSIRVSRLFILSMSFCVRILAARKSLAALCALLSVSFSCSSSSCAAAISDWMVARISAAFALLFCAIFSFCGAALSVARISSLSCCLEASSLLRPLTCFERLTSCNSKLLSRTPAWDLRLSSLITS